MTAAEVQYAVMGRSLAIALVLVAPVLFWMWRTFRQKLQAIEEETNPPAEQTADLNTLEGLLDDLASRAKTHEVGDVLQLEIPNSVSLDGAPAPLTLVDPIVADECRQLGLSIIDISPEENARRFVLQKERS